MLHQTLKMSRFVRVTEGLAKDGFHRLYLAANEQNQSGGLVNLDHLPWQSQLQVAEMAVHYPHQGGDVVGQFGAAAVMLVVNKAEIVLKVNPRTYRPNRAEDVSQGLSLWGPPCNCRKPETSACLRKGFASDTSALRWPLHWCSVRIRAAAG